MIEQESLHTAEDKPVETTTSKGPSEAKASPPSDLFSGPRGLAVKVLNRVEQSDSWLDRLVDANIRREGLDRRDAGLLNEICYGVTRQKRRLDWVLNGFYHGEYQRALPIVKNAMRVALYQILFLDRIPTSAAVNESVTIVRRLKGKRAAGLVNAVLRNIVRRIDSITWPKHDDSPAHYFSVMGSHPEWMVGRWIERFGSEETRQLLSANNERPPVVLNAGFERSGPDALRKSLTGAGIELEDSPLHSHYLRATKFPAIAEDPDFLAGNFTVQDDGAGLAVALTAVAPGMSVIDLCAAPGGKTVAMAEMLKNSGNLVAIDRYPVKAEALQRTIERTGHDKIVSIVCDDATTVTLEQADVVLLDAPCSGLGVLRRKPEIKWKRSVDDLLKFSAIQQELIEAAARLVRIGGHLVYTTCSIEPEENEQVVAAFLAANPAFVREAATDVLPNSAVEAGVVTTEGYLQTYSHRHGSDGAFGARLRRTE